jgi:hypothetical protein
MTWTPSRGTTLGSERKLEKGKSIGWVDLSNTV